MSYRDEVRRIVWDMVPGSEYVEETEALDLDLCSRLELAVALEEGVPGVAHLTDSDAESWTTMASILENIQDVLGAYYD